jgi:NADH-quinone oxidoreductase subunit G
MVKIDGQWQSVSWDEGIRVASKALHHTVTAHGAADLAVLMSASVSTEEYFLAQRLARGLDCPNIDHRLREQDFSDDRASSQSIAFQAPMAEIDDAKTILLIGSNIRHEAPILGQRVRKAWRNGAQVAALNPVDWNFHFELANRLIAAPQHLVMELAALAQAVSNVTGKEIPGNLRAATNGAQVGESHTAMAEMLKDGGNKMLILGQAAMAHEHASWLRQLSAWIATASGATLNIVPHGANTTGAAMAGALPTTGSGNSEVEAGLNVREMLTTAAKGYLLWDIEPEFDFANPTLAAQALASAESVVAVSTFANDTLKAHADVILPLAPLAESEGLFYTMDGQSFALEQAVKASGQSRQGWKILRRLGDKLELDGFSQVDIASLRNEMIEEISQTSDATEAVDLAEPKAGGDLYRVGELAMYGVDALCRRSEYLQQTVHADNAFVGLNPNDAGRKGLLEGHEVKVSQGSGHVTLPVRICNELPAGAVWVKSATGVACTLGDSFGPISVEAA